MVDLHSRPDELSGRKVGDKDGSENEGGQTQIVQEYPIK